MNRIDWLRLMLQEHAACTLIELRQIGKTPSSPNPLLEYTPETFNRVAVVATAGRQEIQPQLLVPVGQRRPQFVRPVDAAAVGDHDDCFCGFAVQCPRVSYTDLDNLICKKSEEEVISNAKEGKHSYAACAPRVVSWDNHRGIPRRCQRSRTPFKT